MSFLAVPVGVLVTGGIAGYIVSRLSKPNTDGERSLRILGIPLLLAILLRMVPVWNLGPPPHLGWDIVLVLLWMMSGVVVSAVVIQRKK
jgi:hypothetical protein